jgi:hypothetical protein
MFVMREGVCFEVFDSIDPLSGGRGGALSPSGGKKGKAMTTCEFAQTLREAAEVLIALADVVEEQLGDDDIDAAMANAAIDLQAALPGNAIC